MVGTSNAEPAIADTEIRRLYEKADKLCNQPRLDEQAQQAAEQASKTLRESVLKTLKGTIVVGSGVSWGILEDQPASIDVQLARDHEVIEGIYDKIADATSPSSRDKARDELAQAVHAHELYEKYIYYPVARAAVHDHGQVDSACRDHEIFERASGEQLENIKLIVLQHMDDEERTIIPAVREVLKSRDVLSDALLAIPHKQLWDNHLLAADAISDAVDTIPPPLAGNIAITTSRLSPRLQVSTGSIDIEIAFCRDDPALYCHLPLLSDAITIILQRLGRRGVDTSVVLVNHKAHAAFTSSPSPDYFMLQIDDFDPNQAACASSFTGATAVPFKKLPKELSTIGARILTIRALASEIEDQSGPLRDEMEKLMDAISKDSHWDPSSGLKTIYDVFSPYDQEQMTSLERAYSGRLTEQQEDERRSIDRAFRESLLQGLAEDLIEEAKELMNGGVDPCMVAEACHAIAKLLRRLYRSRKIPDGAVAVLGEAPSPWQGPAAVPRQDLIDEVAMTLEIRGAVAAQLVAWLLKVVPERPLMFDGFKCALRQGRVTVRQDDNRAATVYEMWAPEPAAGPC